MLEQAPHERKIIQMALREGRPLPRKIANAPTLDLGLELYYNAFWELDTCRPQGFGPGPIPWTAMNAYALRYDMTDEQTDELFHFVRAMDRAYLEHQAKRKPVGKKGGSWQRHVGSGNSPKGWGSMPKG